MAIVTIPEGEKKKISPCINGHFGIGYVQVKTEIPFVVYDQEYPKFSIILDNWKENIDFL